MIVILCPACNKQAYILNSKEAAEYLGISLSTLSYHVHTAGNLTPQKVGHSLVFTQEQLDRFNETRRGPGRPRLEEAHE